MTFTLGTARGGICAGSPWLSLVGLQHVYPSYSSSNDLDHRLRSQHLVSRLLSICAPLNELSLFFSSTIIQDLLTLPEAGSALMTYFYFDLRDLDKQHRRNLLPSLIPLSSQSRPYYNIISRLYSAHDHGTEKPSDSAPIKCFEDSDMVTIPNQQSGHSIFDALDECQNWPGIPSPPSRVLRLSRSSFIFNFRIFIYASLADRSSISELTLYL